MDRHRRRPLFVTLTYPETWDPNPISYKRDLDTFWKRLRRGWWQADKQGNAEFVSAELASAIWRLEEQERGAPHYHLIIFGIRYIDRLILSRFWREVVRYGGDDHEKAGTSIERPDFWEKAGSYVAKYIAKPSTTTPGTLIVDADNCAMPANVHWGRLWGVLGRKNLPTDVMEYDLPEWAFVAIKEVIIEARDDDRGEEWRAAPYRGIWGTCGPGPVMPILYEAGLEDVYRLLEGGE